MQTTKHGQIAVASRLREQDVGWENELIILAPGNRERNGTNQANGQHQPQARAGQSGADAPWAGNSTQL